MCRAMWLALAMMMLLCTGTVRADEFRGLWVDAWGSGFLTASEVTTLVSRCHTYNYNAVVVQMRRRGDAFYIPQSPNGDPRTTALASGYDALQEVINQCHAASPRIEVHCWVTTQLIWSSETVAPTQAGHVYNLHPEYLMKTSGGATFIGEGYFLDPGHPDACQWNYNMAKDIVSRYDIDGLHWDYIRYPAQDSGYSDTAVARYNAEFGLTGLPSSTNAQWSAWRRRQITDFLRWANSDLLAIKPQLQISTAVFADRADAYSYRFQDWAAWNNEGIIDLCMPMNYSSTNSTFNTRVDDAFANQGVRWVYMGQGAYLNTKENTVTQLSYARNKPLSGTLFYSYRTPNSGTVDVTGTFTYVRDNFQPTYEPTPLLPWKATPTKGIVKGTVTRQDNGAAIYNATLTLQTPTAKTQKTEPHGKYAFFEVDPGTYTISATASGLGTAQDVVTITAGNVSNINLVVGTSDTVPPVISSVASSNVTDVAATITWTTDEASDSVVEYGPTTSYGSTASDTDMVTAHSVALSGLSAATTYHYRVKSKDASNNQSVSADYTFTTNNPGQVNDIIIDNLSAVMTGSWSAGTASTDKYATNYVYKGQGTGTAYVTFTPTIVTAGNYSVYEWHPQGTNRTTAAPCVVAYSGGSQTVSVNQQVNGGTWNLLGTFNFAAGTSGNVKITDGFPDAGMVVMADAIKFVFAGAPQPPSAPSGLTATAVSSSQINLAWTDNSSDETNFVVARSTTAGGPYTDIATLAAGSTSYSNTGLTASTTYYYVVRATNAVGASANSNQASATTQAAPAVPAAPSNLAATVISRTQINLTWTDNSTNETNFVVERKKSTGTYSVVATLAAGTTSYSNTGLTRNTTYLYRVKATNAAGSSAYSNEVTAKTLK